MQAKELLDHLESLTIGEAITVVAGHQYVEVKPRGLSKGAAVKQLLTDLRPDFVLCLGDDKSDEEMFNAFAATEHTGVEVYTCTVGQKPSQAQFFVNDYVAVLSVLAQLAEALPVQGGGGGGGAEVALSPRRVEQRAQ